MQSLYDKWFATMEVPMSPDLAAIFKVEAIPE
jgi:hypothetical protein